MPLVYLGPALLGLVCLLGFAVGVNGKPLAEDFVRYHVPEINHFIAHPLGFDTAPGSASAIPGYHWLQALLLRATGHDRVPDGASILRLAHTAIGMLGFVMVARLLAKLASDAITAALLSLLLCASYYPLQMTYYSNNQAPAFVFFIAIITLCVRQRADGARGAELGSCALAMVLMRDSLASTLPVPFILLALRRSWRQAAIYCIYAAIAALIIYGYWLKWGGLTSPLWQREAFPSGGAAFFPASALQVFALTGLFSAFLAVPLHREFSIARKHRTFWIAAAILALAAATLWAISPSTFSEAANRRYSIVWKLAALTPAVGNASPIVLALALAAAPMLALMLSRMVRDRTLYPDTAMCASALAAQLLADLPWQRYVEVPILIALGLFTARFASSGKIARLPLAALAIVYCTASIFRFFTEP